MSSSEQMFSDLQAATGMTGLFSIVVTLLSIVFIWYLLQEVKLEAFFKFPRSPKARMLQMVIAVAIGHLFAGFILDYWNWSRMLKTFVE